MITNSCGCYCECRKGVGRVGPYCDLKIPFDPCRNLKCHNGGTCIRTHHGEEALCLCREGFEGESCNEIIHT